MVLSCLVLTNCTARKRGGVQALTMSPAIHGKDLDDTARRWKSALQGHTPKMPVSFLYTGRAMAEARRVTGFVNGSLWVASAGAGLVRGDTLLAPYDLTPAGRRGGLREVLHRHKSTPGEWWKALCAERSVTTILRDNPDKMLLVALPANYVEMMANDLAACKSSVKERVRLFTSLAGVASLPQHLVEVAMPYDERLETVANYNGTRSDFPQRALRHFVEVLNAHTLDLHSARKRVEDFITSCAWRKATTRRRTTDADIKELIRLGWESSGGRCSVLLRHVRDDAQVACEQGRFSQIWRSVRDEMQIP